MTFHRVKKHLGPTPSDFENGRVTPPEPKHLDHGAVDEAYDNIRRRGNHLRAQELRKDLTTAAGVIGPDKEWGPARTRPGVPDPTVYDDIAHLVTDPTESGHAD